MHVVELSVKLVFPDMSSNTTVAVPTVAHKPGSVVSAGTELLSTGRLDRRRIRTPVYDSPVLGVPIGEGIVQFSVTLALPGVAVRLLTF